MSSDRLKRVHDRRIRIDYQFRPGAARLWAGAVTAKPMPPRPQVVAGDETICRPAGIIRKLSRSQARGALMSDPKSQTARLPRLGEEAKQNGSKRIVSAFFNALISSTGSFPRTACSKVPRQSINVISPRTRWLRLIAMSDSPARHPISRRQQFPRARPLSDGRRRIGVGGRFSAQSSWPPQRGRRRNRASLGFEARSTFAA